MYKRLFYTSSFFLLVCSIFNSSKSVIIPLTGDGWTINNNESYSVQAQIPATIHTILLNANKIPDPYWGYNDINLRHLIYTPWTFRKNFSLSNEYLAFTQFTLYFDQIDTVANITLNECFIGQTSSMFIAYTFNVMKSCLQSTNNLRIDFESPAIYALNKAKAYNDSVPPYCPPDIQSGECHVQFIRKEPCSFSWDWVRILVKQPVNIFFVSKLHEIMTPSSCLNHYKKPGTFLYYRLRHLLLLVLQEIFILKLLIITFYPFNLRVLT